jgi:hypothetical protein
MNGSYMEASGAGTAPDALVIPRARELVRVLRSGQLSHIRFVEARTEDSGHEHVVLDIEPEVPQQPANDIRRVERIGVRFDPRDRRPPEPLALRGDFPRVPHTNLALSEFPRSLCLFDEPYSEQKIRWTATRFLQQLHRWLGRTARGELHEADQPLEQFFVGSLWHAVLPPDLFEVSAGGGDLYVMAANGGGTNGLTLVVTRDAERGEREGSIPFVALVVEGEPRTHGVIELQPCTLAQLHTYLSRVGRDLLGEIRKQMLGWRGRRDLDRAHLMIVTRFPKRRREDGPVEGMEVWAFMPDAPLQRLAEELGMMARGEGGYMVPLIGEPEAAGSGEGIPLQLLNPTPALTRARAAELSGLTASDIRIAAVGAGALGSQTIMNLCRAGYGLWTVADSDVLLPHNLARHELSGFALGFGKADSLAHTGNSLFAAETPLTAYVANVLESSEEVAKALADADLITDLSASVTVARHLAADAAPARRLSLFLNPAGTDLVLLAEDAERRIRLDQLEMCYYRELTRRSELGTHIAHDGERLRYANSCRDVSARIPQDVLSVHSGVAARAIRISAQADSSQISLWRAGGDLSVSRIDVEPTPARRFSLGDWTLSVDEELLATMASLRDEKLPNETGGVLIGSHDLERRIIYLVDTVPSPADSKEWPTLYIRGAEGLADEVRRIESVTGGWLTYAGEWHSHPDGAGVHPSGDDRKVFEWLTEHMVPDGLPPVMAIIGDQGEVAWFVGENS